MIEKALQMLFGQAHLSRRDTVVSVEGRSFLLDPDAKTYDEVEAPRPPDRQHTFGTVAALTDYLAKWGSRDHATVVVSPKGITAYLDEAEARRRDVVTIPYFVGDLPDARPMDHEGLLLYLDQHAGKLEDEAAVRASLAIVTAAEKSELLCHDLGATTKIEMKATRGGVQSANPEIQSVKLPKVLTLTLRTGTREYEIPHKFRLKASAHGNQISFQLVHLDRDRAVDTFMALAIADLRAALGEGWNVYQGA